MYDSTTAIYKNKYTILSIFMQYREIYDKKPVSLFSESYSKNKPGHRCRLSHNINQGHLPAILKRLI